MAPVCEHFFDGEEARGRKHEAYERQLSKTASYVKGVRRQVCLVVGLSRLQNGEIMEK
jgi:hypothetical protein